MSKRYELMSKEEILAAIESTTICSACKVSKKCCIKNYVEGGKLAGCPISLHDWLTEEIKIKKVCRYELIQSRDDLDIMLHECQLKYGDGFTSWLFKEYLKEEVEVEDE